MLLEPLRHQAAATISLAKKIVNLLPSLGSHTDQMLLKQDKVAYLRTVELVLLIDGAE